MKTPCKKCKGLGMEYINRVLSWGISIPPMKCRHCLGTGFVKVNK